MLRCQPYDTMGQPPSALLRFRKYVGYKAFWHVMAAYATHEDQAEHCACCTSCGRGF